MQTCVYAAGGLRTDRGPAVANGSLNPQVLDRAPLVAETFIRYGTWSNSVSTFDVRRPAVR